MKHLIHFAFLFVVATVFTLPVKAENELFPFVISFDAPNNVTNISHRLDAPAGKHGFVRVKDGHFATDKGRIQFWGTNTCFGANFLEHADADRMADRLARFGINCVRLHHMDMHDIWGGYNAKSQTVLDKDQMDKLDYYVAALKKRGIYVNVNLHVSRTLDERDGFPGRNVGRTSFDKGTDNFYRPLIDANKKFAKDLLEHVNPYTGNAYKDESSVAMIEINNENSVICTWAAWGGLHQIDGPFLADFQRQWNDWLKTKYKTDAALRKAWNCRSVPLGDEMFKHGAEPGKSWPKDYVPNWDGWNWETGTKTDASISNVDGVLRMDVRKNGDVSWQPQLIGAGLSVKKDQIYTLKVRAKSNKAAKMSTGMQMNHDPWHGLGFSAEMDLTPAWQDFEFVFSPSVDDDNARINFGSFREGVVYEIMSASLKPGGTIGLPKKPALGKEIFKNGDFSQGYVPDWDGWSLDTGDGTDAPMSNPDGALKIDVKKKGDVPWNPQLIGTIGAVQKSQRYTLTITAKANKPTTASVNLWMNHDPWQGLGFEEQLDLATDWQTFVFTFSPDADDANARITFAGMNEGVVYEIQNVSLRPGAPTQAEESSMENGTVPVVWKSEAGKFAKETVDDFCDFLMDIEAKYWDEMYRYLKDDLKVKQPVSGTQLEYGSTHAQARMDYCDIHAYWNHPIFPRREWDGNDWYLHNRALVNSLDSQILPQLATKRVYGKPFTVSEYNHPYPNRYAAEGLPLLAAFGAFQNWDGIFPFAYSHSKNYEPQTAGSFFDTAGNSVQMAHMIACHTLFCDGYNAEAGKDMIVVPMSFEKEREIFKRDRHQYNLGFAGLGLDIRNALSNPVAVDVSGRIESTPKLDLIPKNQKRFASADPKPYRKLVYDMEKPGRGYASVSNFAVGLLTGFVEEGKEYPFLDGTLEFGKTNLGWATVSLTRLDGLDRPSMLLVATGEMLNTDMKIETLDDDKITVGNRWGKAPVRCEGIPMKIEFKKVPDQIKEMKCWALDESGNRKQEISMKKNADGFSLEIKPEYKTIWYELEAPGAP